MANFNASYDEIRTALSYINSQSRDVWVKVGTALKTEFGEAGFSLFDEWSKTANNYKSDDAKSAYKSFRRGMSNIGYVINQAKQNGWVREKPQAISQAEILERQRKNQELARQAEIERQQKATEAAIYAQKVWNNAKSANPNHAYLQSKGIDNPSVLASIRQDKDTLILPLKNHGKIVGIQKIFESGDKRFNRDIEKKGSAFIIGDRADMKHGFLMAEGFATAATLHQATGKPVVVAFDAGNLKDVANNLKGFVEKHHTTVLICADKDDNKTGEVKALNAKEVLGNNAQVITPDFSDVEIQKFQIEHNGKNPTDFNDLQAVGGVERVKNALADSFRQPELQNKLLINFYGSPATGKTWTAQNLTAQLQAIGVNCEYVSEHATELIKAGRQDELKDQVFVTGEQLRREQEAFARTNLVITDSPTALGVLYSSDEQKDEVAKFGEQSDTMPHIDILLRHDYESLATFSMNGRIHGKEQSLAIQDKLIEMLKGKYPIHHQRAIPLEELINNIRTSQEWQRFAEHNNINLPRFDIDMDGTALGRQPETFSGSLNVAENDTLTAEKTAESITMNDEMPKPERSAWGDFPPAITNADLGDLKNDPDYSAAKAGDIERARNLVNRLLKEETIERMIAQFQPRINTTILLPVLAEETVGKNKIPLAVAEMVSKQTGLPYTTSIFQTNHIGRTNKNADSRLLFQATFGGTVEKNKDYILIDDTLTMGGTVAALRSFVIQNGGRVSGVMVMTAQQRSLQLAPSAELLDNIRLKHGENIENFLQKELGYGLTELTNAEASHIYAYANADTVRTRFAQTRYVESGGMVEETTAPQKSEDLQIAKLTVSLRETHHPKAIIKTEPPTSLCKGEVVHIDDDFVIQRVDDDSRYFQKWNRQDLNIPLQVGNKARIYLDKQGKVQVKQSSQKENAMNTPNRQPENPLKPIQAKNYDDDPIRKAIQDIVIDDVTANFALYQQEYRQHPESFGGRYICSDLFKETMPFYNADRETRSLFNGLVHNSAAVLADKQFYDALSEIRQENDSKGKVAVFLTGSPGAGKTSSVQQGMVDDANTALIYEGQLIRPETAIDKIQAALDSGLKVKILAVQNTPETALNNTIQRFEDIGRGSSIEVMAQIMGKTADGLDKLHQHFGDRIELEIHERHENTPLPPQKGWENLDILRKYGNYETTKQHLGYVVEQSKETGTYSEPAYNQAIGRTGRVEQKHTLSLTSALLAYDERPRVLGDSKKQSLLSALETLTPTKQNSDISQDDETPRPPQGGFSLPENSFRQPEPNNLNPKENLMATNDKELLMQMLDSNNTELRKNAALNEMADDEVLRKAFNDNDESVRIAAISNLNASSEFLQHAFDNGYPPERVAVLQQENVPVETLKDAVTMDDELQFLAIDHKNANEEVYQAALESSIPDIADTAKQRLSQEYGWDDERFATLQDTTDPKPENAEWQPENPDFTNPELENSIDFADDNEQIDIDDLNKPQAVFDTPQDKANAVFEELKTHYQGYGEYNSKDSVMYLPNGKNAEMLHFDPTQERIVLSAVNPQTQGREEIADTHFTDLDPQHIALAVDKDYQQYQQTLAQNQGKFPDEEQKKSIDKAGDSVEEAIRTAKSKTTTLLPPEAPPSDLSERYNAVKRQFMDNGLRYGERTNIGLKTRVDYVDSENGKTVLFSDKGNKLSTAVNPPNEQLIKDMLAVAKAKGWDSIKVSGNREFRRLSYIIGESMGIKVRGYSPSKADLAQVEQLREKNSTNQIEERNQKTKQEKSSEKAQSQPEKTVAKQDDLPQERSTTTPETVSKNDKQNDEYQKAKNLEEYQARQNQAIAHSNADAINNRSMGENNGTALAEVHSATQEMKEIATLNVKAVKTVKNHSNDNLQQSRHLYRERLNTLSHNERQKMLYAEKVIKSTINFMSNDKDKERVLNNFYQEQVEVMRSGKSGLPDLSFNQASTRQEPSRQEDRSKDDEIER